MAEHQPVELGVGGSNPLDHPNYLARIYLVESISIMWDITNTARINVF